MKNNLKNLSFDTRLEESLYNFEKMGSVVEFLLIDNSNNNLDGNEIELVLFTVKTIRERAYAKFYEKQGLLNILDPEITKKEYEQNKDKLTFTKVTPDEFFSPIYSITDKKFVFGKFGQDGLNGDQPMSYEKFVEYWNNYISTKEGYGIYPSILLDPPYTLDGEIEVIKDEFIKLNEGLFGTNLNELVIYKWTTDWSAWFDIGKDWWGSYLYTVKVPEKNWIVGISAATTD